jgi:potassium-dependent mechanosensitive channel
MFRFFMSIPGLLRLSLFLVLLAIALPAMPYYQNQVQPQTSRSAENVLPGPIPVSMIAVEAESASIRVRRIEHEIGKALRVEGMQDRLNVLADSLRRFRPLIESGATAHLDELLNLRQETKRLSVQLLKLQSGLTPRSQEVEARWKELLQMENLWRITYASLAGQEIPPATRDLTFAIHNQIKAALDKIAALRPSLLALQVQISAQRITMDRIRMQTDAAISETKARLFTVDSEPIWKAIASARFSVSLMQSWRGLYQRRALPLFDYLKENKPLLWAHLLIFGLLALALGAVSRKSREWVSPQEEGYYAGQLLGHPVTAALLLSLLLSLKLYPNAPTTFYRLPMLLLVIPLLQLFSAVQGRGERRLLYFLTGIYVLRRLDELVAVDDFLHRAFLLLLTSLSLFGIWLAISKKHGAGKKPERWHQAKFRLLQLAGLILLASFIANIVGSVQLATLLADSCIGSAFLGAALVAGVLTLEGYLFPVLLSPLARTSPAICKYHVVVKRRISLLVRLAALGIWAWLSLGMFGLTEHIIAAAAPIMARQFSFGQTTFSLHGILLFAVTIWLAALIARFLGFLIEEEILIRLTLPPGIPASISMLLRYTIIGLGFVLALAGAGLQWSQIALVAGAIGVGIGLGLQNLVASFIAGLILIFERPIRVGDMVEIGTISGTVTRIGLRSSSVKTYDGSEVICPNSNLISQQLINWTLSSQTRRVEVQVGAAYHSDPGTVLNILKTVAENYPGVLKDPQPVALFMGFGESSLNFVLRFFCSLDDFASLSSNIKVRINEAFREAGIEIPFPQRDIRITAEPSRSKDGTGRDEIAGKLSANAAARTDLE